MSSKESLSTAESPHDSYTAGTATCNITLQEVTVVVPVFNERECVPNLVQSLVDLHEQLADRFAFEFVLVDDGSKDGTAQLLNDSFAGKPQFRVVAHAQNQGVAAAIQTGIRHATNEIVVSIDADGSYDAKLIEHMVPLLTSQVDLVTASPYHPEGSVDNVPQWRLWLSKRASGLYRILMHTKLHCYTACFRVYRRSSVINLQPQNCGYVGVAELLWRVDRAGGTIIEYPAVLSTRVAGQSKMKVFKETTNHLRLLSKIFLDRFGQHKHHSPAKLAN